MEMAFMSPGRYLRATYSVKPHPRRLHRGGAWLFPVVLLVTLSQNYNDLSTLMSEGGLSLFRYEGPILYKIIKDIVYIFLLILIFVYSYKIGRLPFSQFSGGLVLLVMALAAFSAIDNPLAVALIGVRWIFPLILFLLMKDWVCTVDFNGALRWVVLGLMGCLALQFYQLFFMPPVFGEVFPGVAARTPGFFVAPNSAAFFGCASAACVMVFAPKRIKLHVCAVVLGMAISGLAQSGVGMVTSSLLALRLLCGRQRAVFWWIALFGVALALPNLDFLTGRDSYVELSGGGRIDALMKIVDESAFSVTNFGIYTNAANLLSANPEEQLAPDSLIASWVGNFGLFTAPALLLLALFARHDMRAVDWSRAMPCVPVFGLFAMTTIVFEAFPMNLYLAFGVWSAQHSKSTLA